MSTSAELDTPAPPEPETTVVSPARFGWLREAALVLGFYYVYQTIRSLANTIGTRSRAHGNARRLIDLEKTLHIFHEQAIQQAFLGARWLIKAMNVYYGTLHFLITAGLLIWLYVSRHHVYRAMRNLLGVSTALALVGYWSFPLAPPRLYSCNDDVPVPGPGGYTIGKCFVDTLDKFGGLWSYKSSMAKAVANEFAAMPSLHFGWALWCGIVMYRFIGGRWGRSLGIVYPALTLFAIVVTANHYFLDAAGGVVIVVAAHFVLRAVERRRSATPPAEEPLADGAVAAE